MGIFIFSGFLMFLFSITFQSHVAPTPQVLSGVFWIAFIFSFSLALANPPMGLSDRFEQGIYLTGFDPMQLFISKWIANMLVAICISVPLLISECLFFNIVPTFSIRSFFIFFILGSASISALGTFFYSLLAHHSVRELWVILFYYPLMIPLLIFLHRGTADIFQLHSPAVMDFVFGFDLIFVVLCALMYEVVLEELL